MCVETFGDLLGFLFHFVLLYTNQKPQSCLLFYLIFLRASAAQTRCRCFRFISKYLALEIDAKRFFRIVLRKFHLITRRNLYGYVASLYEKPKAHFLFSQKFLRKFIASLWYLSILSMIYLFWRLRKFCTSSNTLSGVFFFTVIKCTYDFNYSRTTKMKIRDAIRSVVDYDNDGDERKQKLIILW